MSNYFIPDGQCGQSYNPSCGLGGIYNNRTFSEIFPDAETFAEKYEDSGLKVEVSRISDELIPVLYYLMISRWANSHPKSSDENRFIMSLFGVVMMYGPSWEARLKVQKEFRDLIGNDELFTGSTSINNHALNPGGAPTMDAFDPLNKINDQTANRRIKPKLEAYSGLMAMIKTDVSDQFLDKFDHLFRNMLDPDGNLYYTTTPEEQEILDI